MGKAFSHINIRMKYTKNICEICEMVTANYFMIAQWSDRGTA